MARHTEPDYSDDDFDLDDEYFARTYRPLSNLPTPPPSSRDASAAQSPKSLLEDGGLVGSSWLGPAVHLVNLIPPAASLATPSVAIVHEMLVRADAPLDTVALAVCILDSLDSKFSRNWRLHCPLVDRRREPETSSTKRHTFSASPAVGSGFSGCHGQQLHIDCVSPEVIVLASLMIAQKFIEDFNEPTSYFRRRWGSDVWTSEQINVTERCIMECLDYHLLPLWNPRLIADALDDMDRAGRQALLPSPPCRAFAAPGGSAHARSISTPGGGCGGGQAIFGLGMQLTPVESQSPTSENCPTAAMAAHVSSSSVVINDGQHDAFAAGLHLVAPLKLKQLESFYDSD
ncbi:hypothetical protein QBC47DRAFT_103690 [Echria macrotheca]|uniref:Cyclin N-terminal domain-containing protein n=1 Tax=Echria macrotheca TaxID=438768 RepID=A0AAJ0F9R0_9PEZI|nr:hypothetical protein QBC47DRAFT_103690 [Echria macrotheca]